MASRSSHGSRRTRGDRTIYDPKEQSNSMQRAHHVLANPKTYGLASFEARAILLSIDQCTGKSTMPSEDATQKFLERLNNDGVATANTTTTSSSSSSGPPPPP